MKVRSDYEAAREGAALAPRWDRRFLAVTGKAPGDMLTGILTGSIPGADDGRVAYSAVLTAKGKMITDLRVFALGESGFLLDVPEVGAPGVQAHFGKYLPPRLAGVEEVTSQWALLTLVGPESISLLETTVLAEAAGESGDGPGLSGTIQALEEGHEVAIPHSAGGALRITPNGDVHPPAWDILLSREGEEELRTRLVEGGAQPMVPHTLDILRVERGRPVFGKDMNEDTIPVEAGIQTRSIDYGKGCYTGQEVIIRLRDRGKVNKRLRGLMLGDAPVPAAGLQLFAQAREKAAGWITSACISPAFGETVALGYVSRAVEPGDVVRVGRVDGPEAQVRALGDEGWV